jgi:hypothetical protein
LARYDIHIYSVKQHSVLSEDLAKKTLNTVSNYGTANLLACRNAQPRHRTGVFSPNHKKTFYYSSVLSV